VFKKIGKDRTVALERQDYFYPYVFKDFILKFSIVFAYKVGHLSLRKAGL
jgi:hypothetical protein